MQGISDCLAIWMKKIIRSVWLFQVKFIPRAEFSSGPKVYKELKKGRR